MRKLVRVSSLVGVAIAATPAVAHAARGVPLPWEKSVTQIPVVPSTLQWIMSLVGLVVAVIGLYMISQINKLTKGGAISGRASYIIVAFMLLGVSSILNVAIYSFKVPINYDFLAHVNEALKIVALGFFVLYFQRVLGGLRGYVGNLEAAERTFVDDAGGTVSAGDAGAE